MVCSQCGCHSFQEENNAEGGRDELPSHETTQLQMSPPVCVRPRVGRLNLSLQGGFVCSHGGETANFLRLSVSSQQVKVDSFSTLVRPSFCELSFFALNWNHWAFVICIQLIFHSEPALVLLPQQLHLQGRAGRQLRGSVCWQGSRSHGGVCVWVFTASLAKNVFLSVLLRHPAREHRHHNCRHRRQSLIFNL